MKRRTPTMRRMSCDNNNSKRTNRLLKNVKKNMMTATNGTFSSTFKKATNLLSKTFN